MQAAVEERSSSSLVEDVVRGVVGGVVAGAVFLVLNMWFASNAGDPAEAPLLMMSTIVAGDDAIATGEASVGAGIAVHVVLSAVFGVVFALLARRLRTNGTVALAGVVYGAVLYVVNFAVAAPLLFEVFEMANKPFEFVAHVLFGFLVAAAVYSSGPRHSEPFVAIG